MATGNEVHKLPQMDKLEPQIYAASAMTTGQSSNGYSRRVLLVVCGLTPQVVTETLYALAAEEGDEAIPTEVHLITTLEGARRAELALLSGDLGWFHRLCNDYRLPDICFTQRNIHVIQDAHGRAMEDIRSQEDNQAAADYITDKVRHFTSDPNASLHVSIAGGRKTMGFYLGYALSLYGREQDRLSHVLVSEPFEFSWDFFYPTPYSRVLQTKDGKLVDTALAEVTLANIPFVSLRHGLPFQLLTGQASFSATVQAAKASLAPPNLVIDLAGRCVKAGEKIFRLPPAELALLAVFARQTKASGSPLAAPSKGAPDHDWATRYLEEYRLISGVLADIDVTERALKNGMDGEYFSIRKSKLDKKLTANLGAAAHPYRIHDGGTRPRRYALALPAESIKFAEIMTETAQRNTNQ